MLVSHTQALLTKSLLKEKKKTGLDRVQTHTPTQNDTKI